MIGPEAFVDLLQNRERWRAGRGVVFRLARALAVRLQLRALSSPTAWPARYRSRFCIREGVAPRTVLMWEGPETPIDSTSRLGESGVTGENRRVISANRPTTAAAVVWITAVQFFVAQAVVQVGWTTPFSLRDNFISDLGNTTCGPYPLDSAMYVCSPWHAWMNASFILFGAQIVVGSILFLRTMPASAIRWIGWVLVMLAGPGVILVGVYPENESIELHRIGAALNFVCGNLGMAVLGIGVRAIAPWKRLWAFTTIAGAIGAVSTVLFVEEVFLGLGIGGMERLAAYPLPVWMIVVGVWWLRRRDAGTVEGTS